MPEVTTARKHSARDRAPRGVFLPPAAGRRLFVQRNAGRRLLPPVVSVLLLSGLLMLVGVLSVSATVTVGVVAAVLAVALWLLSRTRRA